MYHKASLKQLSQNLRSNMTREERHLWYDFLCMLPQRFKRQVPVRRYILDFYCPSCHLSVELDGAQHYEPEQLTYDRQRTNILSQEGIRELRFTNREIHENFYGVCEKIRQVLEEIERGSLPPL